MAANPSACALYGYSEEEFIAAGRAAVLDQNDPRLDIALEERVRRGQAKDVELTAIRKGGERFPVEVDSVILPGKPERSFVITRDISERKRAAESMRRSEERFRAVQENSLDRFTILKPCFDDEGEIVDFTYVYQNARAARTTGRRPEELVGRRMTEVFPTFPQTPFFALYKQVVKTRQATEFEEPYYADGVQEWFRATVTPVPDGIAIATQIITARKRAEEEMRERVRLGEALAAIDAALHSSLDFTELMKAALCEAATAIGAETAGTSMHDDEAHLFRVAYIYNYPEDKLGIRIPDSDDIHGVEAMRTGRTLAIDDTQNDPRVVRELMDAWNIKSVICAPLIVNGRAIAVAYFNYHTAAHLFSEQEVEFVTKLASSLSGALENAQLYEAERAAQLQAKQELATTGFLLEASAELNKRRDLGGTLSALADIALRATPHARVSIGLLAADRSQVTFAATAGKEPMPAGTVVPWNGVSSALREALSEGTTRVADYDLLPKEQRGTAVPVASRLALLVPLVFDGRTVGHIGLDDCEERREFTEREIEITESIAALAATAIENARLYEEQQRIATTLQENFLHPLPEVEGLEMATVSVPAHEPALIGGDFHDVLVLPGDLVVILIGDVAGKGIEAAGMTETVRSAIRTLSLISPAPSTSSVTSTTYCCSSRGTKASSRRCSSCST